MFSLKSFFVTHFSMDIRNEGSTNRLLNIATNNVMAVKRPKLWLPAKLDVMKTENPQNRTTEV